MKGSVYNIIKARFLVNEHATRNWVFITYLILLAMVMIWNTNRYEQKIIRIAELSSEVKELRSEFVDRKSQLMKLKMESTVAQKMEQRAIFPSSVPPVKIKVLKPTEKKWFEKLWE